MGNVTRRVRQQSPWQRKRNKQKERIKMTINDLVFVIGKKQIEIEQLQSDAAVKDKAIVDLQAKLDEYEKPVPVPPATGAQVGATPVVPVSTTPPLRMVKRSTAEDDPTIPDGTIFSGDV